MIYIKKINLRYLKKNLLKKVHFQKIFKHLYIGKFYFIRYSFRSYSSKMVFNCDLCDATYPVRISLSNHKRFKHGDAKQFNCEHCVYATTN